MATTSSLDGVNTYTYNDRGMLLRADGPSGTSTHGYNPDGQLTQRIDAAGTADFTYTNGRPATAADPVTRTLQTLGYNAAGQLSTIDYGSARIRTIGYDPYGRMNSDVLKAGATSVSSITYGYDPDNNVTSKKTTGVAGAGDNTYAYDQLGRLTTWTKGTTATQYGWDNASNRTKVGTKLATYDERNRLLNDGTSTYTYSPRGALLSKVSTEGGTTTTEAFTFDALDRPVQAGTARMRYAGFSDEVVSDGTQFFGRSASDGLLSIGYETTKRLVLSDRHGDAIAGFDPTDTTLSAGLPDTRTFDPFGQSTNATGLKYRIGYQGDWTDPRSGDVNQGARWYNPESGTFNSRDSISYNAGVSSAVPNLYAYGSGNPVTTYDPDGHRAIDPDTGGTLKKKCFWKMMDGPVYVCQVTGGVSGGRCKDLGTCQQGDGDGDGGDGDRGQCVKNPSKCEKKCNKQNNYCKPTGGDCTKKPCGEEKCKTVKCKSSPPKPVCDPECQRRQQVIETREEIETDAKTKPKPSPGDPTCASGNTALCPSDPKKPGTIVGPQGDLTSETSDYAGQLYQKTLKQVGSAVGETAKPPKQSWLEDAFEYGLPGSHFSGGDQAMLNFYNAHPELVHLGIDLLGMVPLVGAYFDGMNAGLYATEGDELNAGLSGAAAIPGIGDAAAGLKIGGKALKLLGKLTKACKVNSFAGNTRVLMADGTTKRIDQVRLGDQVMSSAAESGKSEAQDVTALIVGVGEKKLVDVTIETRRSQIGLPQRSTVIATDGHPFYVESTKTWVKATDLKVGDELLSSQRDVTTKVTGVKRHAERSQVFNLTVSTHHTYYVMAGSTPVLVHNQGPNDPPNIVKNLIADIQAGRANPRLSPDGSVDQFQVRRDTPLKVADKWGGATIYDMGDGKNEYRVLVNKYGDIGWLKNHNYKAIKVYKPC